MPARKPATTAGRGSSKSHDASAKPAPAIVLLGFMGAGKSSVGRALGKRLGLIFEDLDDRIERRERRKVHEIFRERGEAEFRRAEHAALREMLSELQSGTGRVVSLGGGAFVQEANAAIIRAADVPTVFLDADVSELWRRCRLQADREGVERPLLKKLADFRNLYRVRRSHYRKASFRQETTGKTVAEVAAEIIRTLRLGQRVPKRNTEIKRSRKRGEKS